MVVLDLTRTHTRTFQLNVVLGVVPGHSTLYDRLFSLLIWPNAVIEYIHLSDYDARWDTNKYDTPHIISGTGTKKTTKKGDVNNCVRSHTANVLFKYKAGSLALAATRA